MRKNISGNKPAIHNIFLSSLSEHRSYHVTRMQAYCYDEAAIVGVTIKGNTL